jgi:hypothetical protein
MFKNLQKKYDWVLPVVRYSAEEQVIDWFDEKIRSPALEKRQQLIERNAEDVAEVDLVTLPSGAHLPSALGRA